MRKQLKNQQAQTTATEAEQLSALDDYAIGTLSALNRDGLAPLDFAAVQASEELDDVAASLERLAKKGGAVSPVVAQKLRRLQVILAERANWATQLAQVKGMRQWVLDAEHLLDGSWTQAGSVVNNAVVASRLDVWREQLSRQLTDGSLSELEQECLTHFLQTLANLRPHLVQCDDREDFPRTNNDMERSIRGLKTQYRRISGRKNWNSYLLRYGRSVAYATWWEQDAAHRKLLESHVAHLDRTRWRQFRRETKGAQSEQLTRFRFRHKRQAYLASLEGRWAAASPTHPLP